MGLFIAVAGTMALATALILIRPLLAGRASAPGRDSRDAELYRDQLAEIARDVARGVISPVEAEAAGAEVSRRLIGAAARAETAQPLGPAPRRHSALAVAAAVFGAPVLALVVYLAHGVPGLPDLPNADRPMLAQGPSQAEAESAIAATEPPAALAPDEQDYAALIAQLEGVMAERPDDTQGLRLLASGYSRLGRHAEAWKAYERLIGLLGAEAETGLYAAQLDAMAIAAGGYVSPQAEAVLGQVLSRDPAQPVGRYYAGLLMAQQGQIDRAVEVWEKLRAESPADAPWLGFLEMMLAEARNVQSGSPGPGASEIEAAETMSPAERQAMIEGMVARLESRLTSTGGEPEEWLRLINAYVQLGRPEDARRIYDSGMAALRGSEAGFLREQALVMGVIAE
ncbi:MAG TPA: c-type cytochrome biogenesis protein CcmI [Thermohalobaculum sp.]|nr:c-type cytochrome biogenesis protein CcmI [Thermohalobaculum sp.]